MKPEDRAQQVMRIEGPRISGLLGEAAKLMTGRVPASQRRMRIIEIAGKLSRTITPHTRCVHGCSECCSWSLSITAFEARLIGRQVGREPKRLGRELGRADPGLAHELRVRYTGVPCPFLKAGPGGCSIYPVRPLACRTHHTMMDDEANCRIRLDEHGRAINPTPSLNLSAVGSAAAAIFTGEDFGDIREFFPPVAERL
jgi:Fe-S-cluster containining protein